MDRPPLVISILGSILAAGSFLAAYLFLSELADPPDRQLRSKRVQVELRPLPDAPLKLGDAGALCSATDATSTGAGLKRLIVKTIAAPEVSIAQIDVDSPVVLTARASAFDFTLNLAGSRLPLSLSLQRLSSLRPTIFVHSLRLHTEDNRVLVHLRGRVACLVSR